MAHENKDLDQTVGTPDVTSMAETVAEIRKNASKGGRLAGVPKVLGKWLANIGPNIFPACCRLSGVSAADRRHRTRQEPAGRTTVSTYPTDSSASCGLIYPARMCCRKRFTYAASTKSLALRSRTQLANEAIAPSVSLNPSGSAAVSRPLFSSKAANRALK